MGDNRSKSKTSRRAKRAKTNKRNNKRNNKRKQTFRKSRRVNRGGKGPQKRSHEYAGKDRDEKRVRQEDAPQPNSLEEKALQHNENNNYDQDFNATKAKDINEKIEYNKDVTNFVDRKSRYIDTQKDNFWDIVDQSTQLENTKRQREFEDMMDIEDPYTPVFGGKKKRATKRKATRRK